MYDGDQSAKVRNAISRVQGMVYKEHLKSVSLPCYSKV